LLVEMGVLLPVLTVAVQTARMESLVAALNQNLPLLPLWIGFLTWLLVLSG
jgi:hypothetical protein